MMDMWCNACVYGECGGCWSRDPAPWPEWAGEPFDCDCPLHCHCGQSVAFGYDSNPEHHRGMCEHCDAVRCDAYPGACDKAKAD